MHWVVQENLYNEDGYNDLIDTLDRFGLPYNIVKVIPFAHDLIPDITPANPVMVMGATTMTKIARERGWSPGTFYNDQHDFRCWRQHYCSHLLNDDAEVSRFIDVRPFWREFFIRPCADSKAFSGHVTTWPEYADWRRKVLALDESDFDPKTMVLTASTKPILREYRFFIIDGTIITASLYKLGQRVVYRADIDDDATAFAQQMIDRWCPARGFVLDIALIEDGYRVLEINCLNSAGLYAANVRRLIEAIEGMHWEDAEGSSS